MSISFTGTRDGMTEQQKQTLIQVLQECRPAEFHTVPRPGWSYTRPAMRGFRAFCVGDSEKPATHFLSSNYDIVKACHTLVVAPETRGRAGTQWDLGDDPVCED